MDQAVPFLQRNKGTEHPGLYSIDLSQKWFD